MSLKEHIRRILKEDNKKQSLLNIIKQNGLYTFMTMTGLSLHEVYSQDGELPRNVLEQYLIDFLMEEGYETSYDDRKHSIMTTPISHNTYVDYISTEGKTLWVEISEYGDDDNDEPEDVYTTSANNLLYSNIFDIVNEIIERKLRADR
jgi:hypothetical protein